MKAQPTTVCLEARGLSHKSPLGNGGHGLSHVSLEFHPATFNLLFGPQQQGKELLLRLLGLLERPNSGQILVEGFPASTLEDPALELRRNQQFGFVFNAPFLLPSMSVLENVAMPMFKISQVDPAEARNRIAELLVFIGLAETAQESVSTLSTLQQKYISVARSLANSPSVLLVENLDHELTLDEARGFSALLRRAAGQLGITVIATASSTALAEPGDRAIEISGGKVAADWLQPKDSLS